MFDIGFSEIFVIAIVALLVLGPERLPKAARFAGLWVRRARAQWHSVKSELESELAAEELKRSLRETQESLRETQLELGASLDEARNRIKREQEALQRELDALDRDVRTSDTASTTDVPAEIEERSLASSSDPDLHPPQAELPLDAPMPAPPRELPVETDSATVPREHAAAVPAASAEGAPRR
ncbi:Sec-independent protein translocase protein TatB [Lysobacter sp. LF1]|uniref:Sec-independent protein translocase protein TatB n=1 Tax=Lysobacter stagni TaxID=3045172 RepID=A0ABT6XDI3_9GAMM|nr:Sec-independent protein translocase protein TatB [Lysobacter sp. LF1]MDI9238183.1 Sec-independent protein translocase protein TatB [Lysobacter sp. LF1]